MHDVSVLQHNNCPLQAAVLKTQDDNCYCYDGNRLLQDNMFIASLTIAIAMMKFCRYRMTKLIVRITIEFCRRTRPAALLMFCNCTMSFASFKLRKANYRLIHAFSSSTAGFVTITIT